MAASADLSIKVKLKNKKRMSFSAHSFFAYRRNCGFRKLLFLLLFYPAVLEADGAVKHQMVGCGVGVNAEVAQTLELELVLHFGVLCQPRLNLCVLNHFE